MELTENEINALLDLSGTIKNNWLKIVSPTYLWDSENLCRVSVKDGVKEFLSCYESHIKGLSFDSQYILLLLWNKVNAEDFNFEEVKK